MESLWKDVNLPLCLPRVTYLVKVVAVVAVVALDLVQVDCGLLEEAVGMPMIKLRGKSPLGRPRNSDRQGNHRLANLLLAELLVPQER
jgi:hypothetical protein